jgi:hypothetical protein
VRLRASAVASILLSSLAVLGAAGLSLALRQDGLRRDQAYAARYQAQARLAGRASTAPPEAGATPVTAERICVTDLDTFATAIARRFGGAWSDPSQGSALLRRISSLAVIGERHADAAPPPALPQRMGRGRPDPARPACQGTAYAELLCDPALVATCPPTKSPPAPQSSRR